MRNASLVFVLIFMASISFSAIINVPDDQPNIQDGINAASELDTVLIAPGTYTGARNRDLDFNGKNIVLKSTHGPLSTVINSEGSNLEPHRGFYLHSGEDSSAVIEGLTVTGGSGIYDGAGILCDNSSPTIRGNIIVDNSANFESEAGGGFGIGGGLCLYNSSAIIIENKISGNGACGYFGGQGGGLYIWGGSPQLVNNLILDNGICCGDMGRCEGGGIYIYNGSLAKLTGNTIVGNSSGLNLMGPVSGEGGGIYCQSAAPTIDRCIMAYNTGRGISVGQSEPGDYFIGYPSGGGANEMSTADFNADGTVDLAAALVNKDSVAIIFNSGNGSFAPPILYSVMELPRSLVASDVDNDGDADLAIANSGSHTITILLNQSDGTFVFYNAPHETVFIFVITYL